LNHFSWTPETPSTVGQLVNVIEMNQPAVTKAVRLISDHAWIKRVADTKDTRVVNLFITELGLQQLNKARQASTPVIESTLG